MASGNVAVPEIAIDPEFQSSIPPLSAEERAQLEENLVRDGCRDPLVTWSGLILDGHNRYDICRRLDIPFTVREIAFVSRDEASDWIDTNQLGRRNLTPDQASLLRGRRYNRVKKVVPNPSGVNQHTEVSGQNVHQPQDGSFLTAWNLKTAEILAKQYGRDERTIRRDGDFADAVETLKPIVPDIEQRVMAGDVPSKAAVIEAAREPERAPEILNKPHVSHNSGNNEWYTPADYIKAAREVLGKIDLDPASSDEANKVVKAAKYFTVDRDGLAQEWSGRVWMNPPYAQPLMGRFCEKLAAHVDTDEVTAAVVLVNNATETQWFRRLVSVASMVAFPTGRVRFWSPGKESATPLQGQAIVYIGQQPQTFKEAFKSFGFVVSVASR